MTSRQYMKGLAAMAVLSLVAAYCSACRAEPVRGTTPNPADRPTRATLAIENDADVANLLRDSWVSNARLGYFVDDAWSWQRSPFSLYETYWQVRWHNGLSPDVDPVRIGPWLRGGVVGALPNTGLQAIAQVAYAVELAKRLEIGIDSGAVLSTLEKLRTGDMYASDIGQEGTWGSTALAARTLQLLSLPIPPEVVDNAVDTFSRLGPQTDPAAVVESVLPLLDLMATIMSDDATMAGVVRRLAEAADTALMSLPTSRLDASWLGARHQLTESMSRAGVVRPPLSSYFCDVFVSESGVVTLPGLATADLQATFYARELGCAGVVASIERPRTRAGWILPYALERSNALSATAAGMRLAASIGLEDEFSAKVSASINELWLSLLTDSALGTTGRMVAYARISDIAGHAGVGLPPDARGLFDGFDIGLASPLVTILASVYANDATQREVSSVIVGGLPTEELRAPASVEIAVMLELAGRALNDSGLRARALAIIERLRLQPGVYGSAECTSADDCDSMRPSVMSSALGSWVEDGDIVPHRMWVDAGLCQGWVCFNTSDEGMSLRLIATAVACSSAHCGDAVPMLL